MSDTAETQADTSSVPSFVDHAASKADFESLIPLELREAVAKAEAEAEEVKSDEEETEVEAEPVKKASEVLLEDTPVAPEPEVEISDEELDLSAANIEKLLQEDDVEAVKVKPVDETPFWHEDEDYKGFLEKYNYAQIDNSALDNVIKAASEKAAVENKKYVESLQQQIEQHRSKAQAVAEENQRLKNIERSAYFDNLPETIETYSKPMNKAVGEITRILKTEGINVSPSAILTAGDRTAVTKLLENVQIPDEMNTQLVNHWRNYKELEFNYVNDKNAALENMKASINTAINSNTRDNILQTSLTRLLQENPKFKYIDEAISQEALDPNSPVASIISNAKGNFQTILDAIANPTEFSRNTEWLHGLSSYFLKAAHNQHVEQEYGKLQDQIKEKDVSLNKLLKAYLKLRDSAKGITNAKGAVHKVGARGRGKSSKKQEEEALRQMEGLLSGNVKVEEILG